MSTTKMSAARRNRVHMDGAVHRANLKSFIQAQGGKFLQVDFVKKDGCHRTLTGRLGVEKHKGGPNLVEGINRPYLTIYDTENSGYRTINLATVSSIRASGKDYAVVG